MSSPLSSKGIWPDLHIACVAPLVTRRDLNVRAFGDERGRVKQRVRFCCHQFRQLGRRESRHAQGQCRGDACQVRAAAWNAATVPSITFWLTVVAERGPWLVCEPERVAGADRILAACGTG
jgi:hypothetical protein